MERLCFMSYKINAFPYAGRFLRHFIFLVFILCAQISLFFDNGQNITSRNINNQ